MPKLEASPSASLAHVDQPPPAPHCLLPPHQNPARVRSKRVGQSSTLELPTLSFGFILAMAPKHSDIPAPSSSDEEEDTTSEAEEEEDEETSDEEEDQSQIQLTQKISQIKKPEISSPLTAAVDANESSKSNGSESETDPDSAPAIKPLATKPMVDDAKKQQSATKPSASSAKSKVKRPVESNSKSDQKESKRAKKEPGNRRAKNDFEDGEEKGKAMLRDPA